MQEPSLQILGFINILQKHGCHAQNPSILQPGHLRVRTLADQFRQNHQEVKPWAIKPQLTATLRTSKLHKFNKRAEQPQKDGIRGHKGIQGILLEDMKQTPWNTSVSAKAVSRKTPTGHRPLFFQLANCYRSVLRARRDFLGASQVTQQ